MTPTDIQRLRALAVKAANNPWPGDTTFIMSPYPVVALDPATVIALCDLAEKAQPERVEAGLTEMSEAGCMCPRCVEERAMRALERKAAPPSDASGVRAGLR